jgi:ABC-type branched-subunit amino acid transport system substrate-binding protein
MVLTDDLQAIAAAEWASEVGIESVYCLHDTEPYGRGVAEPFAAACTRRGLRVLGGRRGPPPQLINLPSRRQDPQLTELVISPV